MLRLGRRSLPLAIHLVVVVSVASSTSTKGECDKESLLEDPGVKACLRRRVKPLQEEAYELMDRADSLEDIPHSQELGCHVAGELVACALSHRRDCLSFVRSALEEQARNAAGSGVVELRDCPVYKAVVVKSTAPPEKNE